MGMLQLRSKAFDIENKTETAESCRRLCEKGGILRRNPM
jgi:hypothetical protein